MLDPPRRPTVHRGGPSPTGMDRCRIWRGAFVDLLRAAKGATVKKELQMSRLSRNGLGAEDRIDQAWEACVEILASEFGQLAGPLALLADDPGLPQDAEVMGHRRLGDAQLDRATGAGLLAAGQDADDLEPLRVAEGVQDARQLDLIPLRVMQLR